MISNNAVLLSALAACALAVPTTPPDLSKRAQGPTDLWKVPPRRVPNDPKGDAWKQINLVEATVDKAADDGRLYSYYPAMYNAGGSIYVMFSGSPKDVDGMGQDVRISSPTNNGWSKPEIAFPPALLPNQTTVETSEYYCKRGITQRALQPLGIFYTGGDESSPRYYAVAQSSDNICPGSFQSAGRVARRLNTNGNAGAGTFAGEPCWVDTNEYTGAHQWAETVYGTKYHMEVCENKDEIIAALNRPEDIPAQSASLSGKTIVAADGKHNVTYPTNAVYLNYYLGSSSPAPYMRFWADDSTINRTGTAFVEYFDNGKKSFFPLKNDGSNIEESNIYSSWKAWFGSSDSAQQTRVYISNSGMNSDLSSEILTVAVSRGEDLAFRSIGILRTDASKSVPKGTRDPSNTDGPGFWWPSASFAGDKLLVAYSENKASIHVATVNLKDLP